MCNLDPDIPIICGTVLAGADMGDVGLAVICMAVAWFLEQIAAWWE